jgi:hypothetical protein
VEDGEIERAAEGYGVGGEAARIHGALAGGRDSGESCGGVEVTPAADELAAGNGRRRGLLEKARCVGRIRFENR